MDEVIQWVFVIVVVVGALVGLGWLVAHLIPALFLFFWDHRGLWAFLGVLVLLGSILDPME